LKEPFDHIKGVLCDLDGTLYFKNKPISGAVETVDILHDLGIKTLFLTNTDSKTPSSVLKYLHNLGFDRIKIDDIFTPLIALKNFLMQNSEKRTYFVISKELEKELTAFSRIEDVDKDSIPDFVVISDFYDDWRIERLNNAFRYVLRGSKLIGTQGNLYYIDKSGAEKLDTGAFVKLISDSAKNNRPLILGKPSKDYFNHALKVNGTKKNETIMVGDDLETDIKGANNAGIKSVLVRTGKSKDYSQESKDYAPFKIIESIKELPDIIQK
jgi:HAD superfamily hydrolase (TIGR01458 family)